MTIVLHNDKQNKQNLSTYTRQAYLTVSQDKRDRHCPDTADQHGPTTHGVVLPSRPRFVVAVLSTRK